ncbi:MAG: hypothetical protein J2P36_25735, partial [Ktedonobacteraceae bacterium]|nr:hypothetical protein [Ktedonobacteraceae bacterium]
MKIVHFPGRNMEEARELPMNASLPVYLLPGDDRQVTIQLLWQTGSIASSLGMRTMLKIMRNTPPPGRYISI